MSAYDKLDDAFDITPQDSIVDPEVLPNQDDEKRDLDSDYEYSREQLYTLIQKGQKAVDGIIDVANSSDHPRAYEVAFQGMKHLADMTDKLIDLQKKMKNIEEEIPQKGPSTVNNTMFVGSTAELQKFLKQSKINNKEE